jgi:HPt (histidine-containing phosphotransfer) domain-containing protein
MTQPALDAGAFAEMKEIMGDSFKEVISMCLESLPQQSEQLSLAITENNADDLFNVAHRMKSSCGSIGAFGLAEKAASIEQVGREGSVDGASEKLSELQSSLQEVLTLLKAEVET